MVRTHLLDRHDILPHLALFYVTHRCNAHCAFCSRATQVFSDKCEPEADLERTHLILSEIHRVTPALYVTGGEPLILPDITKRLRTARELGFCPILLNTNATLLHLHWGVLDLLDTLVVSLHTLDIPTLARTYRVDNSMIETALASIARAAQEHRMHGKARVMANCVLTSENVFSAHRVLEFCVEHGITLAVVPAIIDQNPAIDHADADAVDAYERFIDRVVAQKEKDPGSIQGTLTYLEHIRDRRQVKCRPTGIMTVSPDGHVLHPCDKNFNSIGRISTTSSALSILKRELELDEPFRQCLDNCLKACYTQTALALEYVIPAISEYLLSEQLGDVA